MAILSDSEIKTRVGSQSLIQYADLRLARECSYSFRPGKAFPVNSSDQCIDFVAAPDATLSIKPGEMIWVRTREQVRMPIDLAGFWWQTNSLSRMGLMLVNMSMVEPIYRGDLACLFVNFGDQIIVIEAETAIAKMVFIRIEGTVDEPYQASNSATRAHYDSRLLQLAINQPSSFLKIGDISENLENDKERIISEVENKLNTALEELRNEKNSQAIELREELEIAKSQVIADFKSDAPRHLLKSYSVAALGLIFLGMAITLSGWIKDYAWADSKEIAKEEAEKVVSDRLTVDGKVAPSSIEQLEERLEKLEAGVAREAE